MVFFFGHVVNAAAAILDSVLYARRRRVRLCTGGIKCSTQRCCCCAPKLHGTAGLRTIAAATVAIIVLGVAVATGIAVARSRHLVIPWPGMSRGAIGALTCTYFVGHAIAAPACIAVASGATSAAMAVIGWASFVASDVMVVYHAFTGFDSPAEMRLYYIALALIAAASTYDSLHTYTSASAYRSNDILHRLDDNGNSSVISRQ